MTGNKDCDWTSQTLLDTKHSYIVTCLVSSKGKCYTQEFKIEAVKQIIERGYSVAEVSDRLGICTKMLFS